MISLERHPVWHLRSRRMAAGVRFWLAIVGLDLGDRSLLARTYLLYVVAFLSIWVLAVVSLFASFLSESLGPLLEALGTSLPAFYIVIATIYFTLWFGYSLIGASRRSPLVFSDEDAYLLCQTPVSRRVVAVAWFVGSWPTGAAIVLGVAMMAASSLVEAGTDGVTPILLARLAIAMLRPLTILGPLHAGLTGLVWAVGAWRLRRRDVPAWNVWGLRIVAVALAAGILLLLREALFGMPTSAIWRDAFLTLQAPIVAAFGQAGWIRGLTVALGIMAIGLALMWVASGRLSLSLASQETRKVYRSRMLFRLGAIDAVRELADRDRLGSSRRPSRLPTRPGAWMIAWKGVIQAWRPITFARLLPWLTLVSLTIGVLMPIPGPVLAFVAIYWIHAIGGRTSARLAKDLGNWWTIATLPIPARGIILGSVAYPAVVAMAITWCAMALRPALGLGPSPVSPLVVPPAVLAVALAYAYDLLSHTSGAAASGGREPAPGVGALILGAFCLAPMVLLSWWAASVGAPMALAAGLSLGVEGLIVVGLLRAAAGRLERMG